jgi:hypothetical protein
METWLLWALFIIAIGMMFLISILFGSLLAYLGLKILGKW